MINIPEDFDDLDDAPDEGGYATVVGELEDLLEARIPLDGDSPDVVPNRLSVAQLFLAGEVARVVEDQGVSVGMELARTLSDQFEAAVMMRLKSTTQN